MNANWWVLIGQLLVFAGVGVTVIWGQRHLKRQPEKDEAEAVHTDVDSDRLRQVVEEMAEKYNARRDKYLIDLSEYMLIDSGWHFDVLANERELIATVKELMVIVAQLGGEISHIIIPSPSRPPPRVPDPPPIAV